MDEEELNPKSNIPPENKIKKEPIFFNTGLVYKNPPTNQTKNEKRFEEKSENYPTIMENKSNNNLADYEKKNPILLTHERPKSTNPEHKKEATLDFIEEKNVENLKHKPLLFNDEKKNLKDESPGKRIDFNIHKEVKETNQKSFKEEKSDESSKFKIESIKERLGFINSQCQDIISHFSLEIDKYILKKINYLI